MRDSHSARSLIGLIAVSAALLVLAFTSSAQTLSVELGFEGRLTPERYAPILIEVHDYRTTESGRLRITQRVGNEWRGEATMQQELGYAIQSSGRYEAVIPIYDPVNPIIIELLSATDAILATEAVDLRGTMRPMPYPVLDKQLPRFDDRAAVIDPSSLPTQWWGFDSAESLWVASPLTSETWTAISQWVLAGGSLVVLTGTNFYRMDSPILRELLPISHPEVAVTDQGTSYLGGSHEGATIDLISDEGFPLLLHSDHGAGRVSLVSVGTQAVSVEILRLIATHIAPSQLLTLQEPTKLVLGAQTIVALNSLFVLILIVLLGVLICVCAVIGRLKPRVGWAILLIGMTALSVSSGFASNQGSRAVDVYTVNTNVYLQGYVTSLAVFSSLFSQTPDPFVQTHTEELLPLLLLPRTLKGPNAVRCLTVEGETKQTLPVSETRSWHAYGNASSVFDFHLLSDTAVRIINYYPDEFDTVLILIDGRVHSLANVQQGSHDYALDSASTLRLGGFLSSGNTGYAQSDSPAVPLVRAVKDAFPLSTGIWLLAVNVEDQLSVSETTQKVRDITLVVVRDEEGSHEI